MPAKLSLVSQCVLSAGRASVEDVVFSCPNHGGSHVMVDYGYCRLEDAFVIDPAAGCIYLCNLREISPDHLPNPMTLPHFCAIPGCDLRTLVDRSSPILSYDCPTPNIFPNQFGSATVILAPKERTKTVGGPSIGESRHYWFCPLSVGTGESSAHPTPASDAINVINDVRLILRDLPKPLIFN